MPQSANIPHKEVISEGVMSLLEGDRVKIDCNSSRCSFLIKICINPSWIGSNSSINMFFEVLLGFFSECLLVIWAIRIDIWLLFHNCTYVTTIYIHIYTAFQNLTYVIIFISRFRDKKYVQPQILKLKQYIKGTTHFGKPCLLTCIL